MGTKTILYFSFSEKEIDRLKTLLSFNESNELHFSRDAREILERVPDSSLALIDAFDKSVANFIKRIREASLLPIVCFVREKEVSDSVVLLDAGADVVLEFGIAPDEFKAQVSALLKRTEPVGFALPKQDIAIGNARIDVEKRTLVIGESAYRLVKKEFQLLVTFTRNANVLLKRDDLLRLIWENTDYYKGRSMDVYLCHVRKYISLIDGVRLVNIRSEGYKLEVAER